MLSRMHYSSRYKRNEDTHQSWTHLPPSTPVFSGVHCSNVNRAKTQKHSIWKASFLWLILQGSRPISVVNEQIWDSHFWFKCLTTTLCLSRIRHSWLHSKRLNPPTAERAKLGVPCFHVKNKLRRGGAGYSCRRRDAQVQHARYAGYGHATLINRHSQLHQGNTGRPYK